ncbi:MAG: MFS transporter, partial [Candidatus Dormibacteraceae bacterium]
MAVRPRGVDPRRPRLISPRFVAFLALTVATMVGVYLLFSVLPLYASTSGGPAAGLVTGALMLATVLTEIATPSLMVRIGARWVLGLGAVLLALPTALLLTTHALPAILAVALARGFGLGLTVVTGTAVAAEIAPPHRRSEALAVYGLAGMIPGALAQPAGLWVAGEFGFSPDFVIAVATPLAACWLVLFLASRRGGETEPADRPSVLLTPGALRPALIFLSTTIAAGIYSTFLALALGHGAAGWAAVALLAQNGA